MARQEVHGTMRHDRHSQLSKLISVLVAALVSGAVLAGAAFPATAIGGLAAKAGADAFEALPADLNAGPLPQTSKVLTADGQYVTSLYGIQNRSNVSLSSVPPSMRYAVIATEDSRFYQHNGVDLKGIIRAFVSNSTGGKGQQGASTLTQQYVRQDLYMTSKNQREIDRAIENTPARKLREMRYAIALEKKLTKAQILERYLNTVYFGNGAYGVAVAAQRYFSKPVSQLTLSESALLASYVKDPNSYPNNPGKAEARRKFVLGKMRAQHFITPAQQADAIAHPPAKAMKEIPNSCLPNGAITEQNNWGYFCDYLRIWARQQPALGSDPDQRFNKLRTGGYTIKLSLDPKAQQAAQESVDSKSGRGAELAQGAVLVEPGTGRIRAMAVNRTFANPPSGAGEDSQREYSQNPLLTGDPSNQKLTGYPSGSTFKMFTMLAALNQGIPLSTSYDSPDSFATPGKGDGGSPYVVQNASPSMTGRHTMWSGFGASVNTYFIQLEMKAKVTQVAKIAAKSGISFYPGADGRNSIQRILAAGDGADARYALTFGQGSETWPLFMANAYATVAARGMYCAPTPIQSITGPDGKPLNIGAPDCTRAFPAAVADAATDAARCPVGQQAQTGSCSGPGGATAASVGSAIGRPVAGKTGSTPENRQLWFAGYVPQLAGATFSTDPDRPYAGATNGDLNAANDIFRQTMAKAVENLPQKNFTRPPATLVNGNTGD